MNKPKGFVTTASDPHADKTVMDLLKGCPTRVFPVGRLDKNTTGVLMFTNVVLYLPYVIYLNFYLLVYN